MERERNYNGFGYRCTFERDWIPERESCPECGTVTPFISVYDKNGDKEIKRRYRPHASSYGTGLCVGQARTLKQ